MSETETASRQETLIVGILREYMEDAVARGIFRYGLKRCQGGDLEERGGRVSQSLLQNLNKGIDIFLRDESMRSSCKEKLADLGRGGHSGKDRKREPAEAEARSIHLKTEDDIVVARNEARAIAEGMGFTRTEQIKIATSVSEMARNVIRYVGEGAISFEPLAGGTRGIKIICIDHGHGIPNLSDVLSGQYRSKTGLGLGILGCRKIMDEFDIETGSSGTLITAVKYRN